jgi:hypothetical protein
VLSHQNGQVGRDSVPSPCASAIFCGTVALLSARTVVLMMEQLLKEAVLNVSGLNTLSTGARVVGLDQDQVMMQDIKPCNAHLKLNTMQSRVFKYCKEFMSTMKLKLGRVSEVEVSQASLIGTRLRRFSLFANVLVFK